MENNRRFGAFFVYVNKWCPRRRIQASKLSRYFAINNLIAAKTPSKADLIVIFTCGSFEINEELSILTIEKSLREKSAKIVITGCLPKINPERLKTYDNTLLIPPRSLNTLDSMIGAKVPYSSLRSDAAFIGGFHDLYKGHLVDRVRRNVRLSSAGSNSRISDIYFRYLNQRFLRKSEDIMFSPRTCVIEIAESCLGNCSYCAIKLAAEKFHSFPEERILESFRSGLDNGYKDFALLAGDIGCYGVDIGTNLPNLLKKLFALGDNFRILLWDLNVRWFIKYYDDFRSVLKANSRKVSRVVLPIESGSDRILNLMNRGYEIEEVKNCILDLEETIPDLELETHIIVGFPGETEEDFQKSLELIKEMKFSKVVLFRYEDRPNTRASSFPDKVPKEVIDRRVRMLAKEDKVILVN
jgi:tRNA A37 methylthiotransferase MiaB